ncbi:Asp-tRNA(Asn)/Glu-tRNA(Gln) amidotransferase subunit GatC [Legionella nagasakiensis]|uniref:Asp-tRNA(Asn)/Glu-tRNA(Gln) amidotransferase subunit GatC n=1 Tax=Legionella nagasakiensis TaxID=535290 RepID=UPI001054B610|nr:Asp-tRNA(Asn)/Glu-tRNA(Gln) amidotransferase subunit GatC [Legionella nagasakiensis]
MITSKNELNQIAELACIELSHDNLTQLTEDIQAIMNFVEQLRTINTEHYSPMLHPLDLHQPLRNDEVKEENCVAELETIAPLFAENLYLVPKVIDIGK